MCKRLFKALKIKMDNYHLRYELAGADETISQLKQQLAEKDKEIEKLNTIIEVKDETIKHYSNWLDELRFRERNINGLIEQLPNQNQTAIDELEKEKPMEKRKMIISKLTVADYKAILDAMTNLGIDVSVEVIDQNGLCVYAKSVTKPKHIKGESR